MWQRTGTEANVAPSFGAIKSQPGISRHHGGAGRFPVSTNLPSLTDAFFQPSHKSTVGWPKTRGGVKIYCQLPIYHWPPLVGFARRRWTTGWQSSSVRCVSFGRMSILSAIISCYLKSTNHSYDTMDLCGFGRGRRIQLKSKTNGMVSRSSRDDIAIMLIVIGRFFYSSVSSRLVARASCYPSPNLVF